MFFLFLIPALEVCIFCLAIGRTPTGLDVSVYNADSNTSVCGSALALPPGIAPTNMSEIFLSEFASSTISIHPVSSLLQGEARGAPVFSLNAFQTIAVRAGDSWGVFTLSECFSYSVLARYITSSGLVSELVVNNSRVSAQLDNSNFQISIAIQTAALTAYENMLEAVLPAYNKSALLATSPVQQEPPVFGQENPTFTDFITPRFALSAHMHIERHARSIMPFIIFALSIGLTALSFISEKTDGLLSRVYASGTRPIEIVLATFLAELVVLLIQVAFMLVFALLVFNIPLAGNLAFVVIVMTLMGFLGMTYGMFISTVTDDKIGAIQLALGTFFPVMLLSGVLWPVEGIPVPVIYLSNILPTTWGGNVVRCILVRGWGFDVDQVPALSRCAAGSRHSRCRYGRAFWLYLPGRCSSPSSPSPASSGPPAEATFFLRCAKSRHA